mgnify:CR=1 FL=1
MSKSHSEVMTKGSKYFPYLAIAPSMILIVVFMFIPIFQVFHLSLQHYDYNDFENIGYIGLENFKKIFTDDDVFFPSALFTLKWVIVEVALQLIFGMGACPVVEPQISFPWAGAFFVSGSVGRVRSADHNAVDVDL